jgi:hypothetical protein
MPEMDPQLRAFYEYHACLMEPWDGPAATAFTDGVVVAAAMDRNGLRPARYQVTSDRLVIMGSEVGMLGLPLKEIVESGRVGPSEMIAVDTLERRFLDNDEIKLRLATARPYGRWVQANLQHLDSAQVIGEKRANVVVTSEIPRMQALHGYTKEEVRDVLMPMARDGTEGRRLHG